MTTEPQDDQAKAFQRQNEIAFGIIERAVVRKLLGKGMPPYVLANALLSHGSTLLAKLDGKAEAAAFLEGVAGSLRELDEAAQVAADKRH